MKLGFYYHINCFTLNNKIHLPSYLGLFVDELAKHVEQLFYFTYTTNELTKEQNYTLQQTNIQLVNLGIKKSYPYTIVRGSWLLSKFESYWMQCDVILVRGPSPLAPYFYFKFKRNSRIYYLMVGDYMEGIKHQQFSFFKQRLINLFTRINEQMQNQAIKYSGCLVNSLQLMNKYKKINANVKLVNTTTLTPDSFYKRQDTCKNKTDIKLLFVGRIERAKGINELIDTFIKLRENNYPVSLNLVGWESKESEDYFKTLSENTLTKNAWQYHGVLNNNELLNIYRICDIFILPSYHEGFPRVIWEAMANSLPVIATSVGNIPFNITHGQDALLIPPKDSSRIYNAVLEIIESPQLRHKLILNAQEKVADMTMNIQVKKMIEFIL